MWRLDKEGSVVSDMQLTTLEELEDHISDMQDDELKELKVDIHNFLDYWPHTSKQHTSDDISHIFGVVRFDALILFWAKDNFSVMQFGLKNPHNTCS